MITELLTDGIEPFRQITDYESFRRWTEDTVLGATHPDEAA